METCKWTHDPLDDERVYETSCGQANQFGDGGPVENGYKFCPYCGKEIELKRDEQ